MVMGQNFAVMSDKFNVIELVIK